MQTYSWKHFWSFKQVDSDSGSIIIEITIFKLFDKLPVNIALKMLMDLD